MVLWDDDDDEGGEVFVVVVVVVMTGRSCPLAERMNAVGCCCCMCCGSMVTGGGGGGGKRGAGLLLMAFVVAFFPPPAAAAEEDTFADILMGVCCRLPLLFCIMLCWLVIRSREAFISSMRLNPPAQLFLFSVVDEEEEEDEEEECGLLVELTAVVRGVLVGGTKAMLPLDVIMKPPWFMLAAMSGGGLLEEAAVAEAGRNGELPLGVEAVGLGTTDIMLLLLLLLLLVESSTLFIAPPPPPAVLLKLSLMRRRREEEEEEDSLAEVVALVLSFFSSSLFRCSSCIIFSLSSSSSLLDEEKPPSAPPPPPPPDSGLLRMGRHVASLSISSMRLGVDVLVFVAALASIELDTIFDCSWLLRGLTPPPPSSPLSSSALPMPSVHNGVGGGDVLAFAQSIDIV
jgi:hypothetical protein